MQYRSWQWVCLTFTEHPGLNKSSPFSWTGLLHPGKRIYFFRQQRTHIINPGTESGSANSPPGAIYLIIEWDKHKAEIENNINWPERVCQGRYHHEGIHVFSLAECYRYTTYSILYHICTILFHQPLISPFAPFFFFSCDWRGPWLLLLFFFFSDSTTACLVFHPPYFGTVEPSTVPVSA